MKKIYYLQEHEVKLGDIIEYEGIKTILTEKLIELNPKLFKIADNTELVSFRPSTKKEWDKQELLDKAKRDYPIGTIIKTKYGIHKVLENKPFVCPREDSIIQIKTDRFSHGTNIYTIEDGWAEILPLKFTTEDGVDIYGDMKTYAVAKGDLDIDNSEIYGGTSPCFKYFYHKENALAYIEKHKEKTLEDYESILFERGDSITFSSDSMYFSVYGWLEDNEPKLYYTKILQLIADDLNDGWVADFSKGGIKWYISEEDVELSRLCNHGAAHFKTRELAKKARLILGDNVKYLFN